MIWAEVPSVGTSTLRDTHRFVVGKSTPSVLLKRCYYITCGPSGPVPFVHSLILVVSLNLEKLLLIIQITIIRWLELVLSIHAMSFGPSLLGFVRFIIHAQISSNLKTISSFGLRVGVFLYWEVWLYSLPGEIGIVRDLLGSTGLGAGRWLMKVES